MTHAVKQVVLAFLNYLKITFGIVGIDVANLRGECGFQYYNDVSL